MSIISPKRYTRSVYGGKDSCEKGRFSAESEKEKELTYELIKDGRSDDVGLS